MTAGVPVTDGPLWAETEVTRPRFAATVLSRLSANAGTGTPGGRFAGLFGSAHGDGSVMLRAAISHLGRLEVLGCLLSPGPDGTPALPALAPEVAGASWYERELSDMFGLVPDGQPRVDPLVLPRDGRTPPPCPGRGGPVEAIGPDESALPAHVSGMGIFTLPYGPVRSGIFESVQYLIETPGEDIPHVRARVYHKHRGTERRFEGMSPADGALLAERTEGVASVAHAMAFCQAVEAMSGGRGTPGGTAVPEGPCWSGPCMPNWSASPTTSTPPSAIPRRPARPWPTPAWPGTKSG